MRQRETKCVCVNALAQYMDEIAVVFDCDVHLMTGMCQRPLLCCAYRIVH